MLILGARYGSVDPKTSLSYTELEYDYADSKGKPLFSVVITEAAIDRKTKEQGRKVLETDRPQELRLFREKVLRRMSSFFDDPKDIKLAVHETIADFLTRYEFSGWVPASEVPNTSAFIEEVSRLQKRNTALEAELTEMRQATDRTNRRVKGTWDEEELREIVSMLSKIEIETELFTKDKDAPPARLPLLSLVSVLRDRLIAGVENQPVTSDLDHLLFFNVFPKLEIYGLAAPERVAGVAWRLYRLSQKGMALLAYVDKNKLLEVPSKDSPAGKDTSDKSPPKKKRTIRSRNTA
jgi:hypothetical protein